MLTSTDIRERFLAFFARHGHERVASSSLVPGDDPTLMFTNAGMVQFKDVFLGFDHRGYDKAVTSQRCLRAGGKHNDLENVGYTARHHTFFEMLGNFSFGDYFKERAIPLAWELLTAAQADGGYGLRPEHLWVTVFGGGKVFGPDSPGVPADAAARDIWINTLRQSGFSAKEAAHRVTTIPTADNFWMMGDTGPCGPCSEIFYNKDAAASRFEGGDADKADTCVEIWNLVFMQFNRDTQGVLHDLPAPCVDTGMGLERLCAVLQDQPSNYETDLFTDLVAAAAQAVTAAGGTAPAGDVSLRVIADHIRACAYLVADKVLPSNEGRGYVLRRIIRRALRHGHHLGANQPFFAGLTAPLAELMGTSHPELPAQVQRVTQVLAREEERFSRTLHEGMRILTKVVTQQDTIINGATVFKLYDTYGFPADLTASYARDHGMQVDMEGFERELAIQRERSRAASNFRVDMQAIDHAGAATRFERDPAVAVTVAVLALHDVAGQPVTVLEEGDAGLAILAATSFYGEAGGQVGDRGMLRGAEGQAAEVVDTVKVRSDVHGHRVQVTAGELRVGMGLRCEIDRTRRQAVSRAHSATHVLHEALRRALGDHVEQRGSLVDDDRLRFDFSHDGQLGLTVLKHVERDVNAQVLANAPVSITELAYDEAIQRGARALFGEKYGTRVRMVTIDPAYSIELCGGTHVSQASEIGYVFLMSEEAVAAGIRRIEARVGLKAQALIRRYAYTIGELEQQFKQPEADDKLLKRVRDVTANLREAQADLKNIKAKDAEAENRALVQPKNQQDTLVGRILVQVVQGKDVKLLSNQAKKIMELGGLAMTLLLASDQGKVGVVAIVRPLLHEKITAQAWVTDCAALLGARGGGSAAMAQARGGDPAQLTAARARALAYALQRIGSAG